MDSEQVKRKETRVPQIGILPPGWMSVLEASKSLGYSKEGTIRTLARNGLLEVGYVGNSMYVTEASVEEYRAKHRNNYPGRPKKAKEPAPESE